jgi:hypothetical protein
MTVRERWQRHRRTVAERRRHEPVGLTVVPNEPEAEIICGLLRTNGIGCSYRKTDTAGAWTYGGGGPALGPFEVLVSAHELARARELTKAQ